MSTGDGVTLAVVGVTDGVGLGVGVGVGEGEGVAAAVALNARMLLTLVSANKLPAGLQNVIGSPNVQ